MKYLLLLTAILSATTLWGNPLRHIYTKGEKYRIITEVHEKVLVNGKFLNRSHILNKVSINTADVKKDSGRLDCHFLLSEQFSQHFSAYTLQSEYHSTFWRDQFGSYIINNDLFMPVLRNIPSFPQKKVNIGDAWTLPGEEVHDLRKFYKISKPFRFPVQVYYTYLRDEKTDGIDCAVLNIEYTTFHIIKDVEFTGNPVPVKITGISKKIYFWNKQKGRLHKYSETFDYYFHLSNGTFIEYTGTSIGTLIPSKEMDKESLVKQLKKEITKQKLNNTQISTNKDGITITLENIQFPPYSSELKSSEKKKLQIIASILKKFPNRDFLITGHTAKVGQEKTSIILSLQRARAVSDFLYKLKSFKKNQVILKGYGSQKPVADNKNEEGRRKNRRVEITILEN